MTDGQVDYRQVERNELLRSVDKNWIDHIDAMDQLRKGIGLRGYAQQDPVIAYKQEGYEMFDEMIGRIQTTTISRLLKGRIVRVQNGRTEPVRPAAPSVNDSVMARAREVMQQRLKEQQQKQAAEETSGEPEAAPAPERAQSGPVIGDAPKAPKDLATNIGGKQLPKNAGEKIGRNDPCPCGSGKKYKDCCYWKENK